MGLSEKAKGKQKAISPSENNAEDAIYPQYRDLRTRFSDGVPDVTLTIRPGDTIRDVKRRVCVTVTPKFLAIYIIVRDTRRKTIIGETETEIHPCRPNVGRQYANIHLAGI